MLADILFFALGLLGVLFIGSLLIVLLMKMPTGDHIIEDLAPERLSKGAKDFFAGTDAIVGPQGFRQVKTFIMQDLPMANENRFYISHTNHIVVHSACISPVGKGSKLMLKTAYFIYSYFKDGHVLAVSRDAGMPLEKPPWVTAIEMRPKTKLPEMLNVHYQQLELLSEQDHNPLEVSENMLVQLYSDYEKRVFAYQREYGLLKAKKDGVEHRGTIKLGLLVFKNFVLSGGRRLSKAPHKPPVKP